jgi:DNA-binding Lrp family transcriptional regulator
MRSSIESEGRKAVAIDATDLELIAGLVADGRGTYTDLGLRAGLSPASARNRVLRLLQEGAVTVSARVHAATMGQNVVEVGGLTINRPALEVAAALQDIPEVVFVVCTTGHWGLAIEVRSLSARDAREVSARIARIPGVLHVDLGPVVDYFKQDWSGLGPGTPRGVAVTPRNPVPSPFALDTIDRQVVSLLMHDGRATYADVGTATSLSPAAARNRVQRLLESQVVVVQSYVSPDVLGPGMYAGFSVAANAHVADLAARLAQLPETTLVLTTTGRYEIVGEVWCKDTRQLLTTIDHIRAMDDVHRVECTPYLVITKESFGLDLGGRSAP